MNPKVGLIGIAAIFLVPPIVAVILHMTGVTQSDPQHGKNNGELIHPARPLQELSLLDESQQPVDIKRFEGYWSLLQVAGKVCAEDCQHNLYKMRQIRLALGKDAHRVQRVQIAKDWQQFGNALVDNPGTLLLTIAEQPGPMLRQFPDYIEGDIASISGYLYIVDPLGNLAMRYPANTEPTPILKDLRHLLKATWIRPRTD